MAEIEVVRAGEGDLPAVIATRLRALTDAPEAFGSTLERERSLTRAQWLVRMQRGPWWLARPSPPSAPSPVAPVGLVAACPDPDVPEHTQLVSMWVAAEARGGPAAPALVTAVVDWAAGEDHPAVVLWVVSANERARRLYSRMGFTPTGRSQPLPSDPQVLEEQMIRWISPADR
jgi:RimJ/RimL family protein N-acetyltransferase